MFGFGKKALDEDTIALIAIRAGVLVRAEEKDKGSYAVEAIDRWLEFAIKESALNPDAKSKEALRYCAAAVAGDCSGFTEKMFLRSRDSGDRMITPSEAKRVFQITSDSINAMNKGMSRS